MTTSCSQWDFKSNNILFFKPQTWNLFNFVERYMHALRVNKEIKNALVGHKIAFLLPGCVNIDLWKRCFKCKFSVMLSNLNLNHVRLYDEDPLCERGAVIDSCQQHLQSSWHVWENKQLITFQKSPKPFLYSKWFNNSFGFTLAWTRPF